MDSEKLHIYEILARQQEPILLAYVLSLVSDPQLAEDIAQETFLIAYRKIATLKNPAAFGPWLRGIARWEGFLNPMPANGADEEDIRWLQDRIPKSP